VPAKAIFKRLWLSCRCLMLLARTQYAANNRILKGEFMKNIYPVIGLVIIAGIIFLSTGNMFLPGVLMLVGLFYVLIIINNKKPYKTKCEDGG